MTLHIRGAAALLAVAGLSLLSTGCIIVVDGNDSPDISPSQTFWDCARDADTNRFFFEFQAVVTDPDGRQDVNNVFVEVLEAGTSFLVDDFDLNYEGDDVWGGFVWEADSNLRCGDAYDVVFLAVDDDGATDQLIIPFGPGPNSPPNIDSNETFWDCGFDASEGDWTFEFQTRVTDPDGVDDVVEVSVFVYAASSDFLIEDFLLLYEGNAIWGGVVFESSSNLRCGEEIDVLFEAVDSAGAFDSFTLYY